MGLIKKQEIETVVGERRTSSRSKNDLMNQLSDPDSGVRRKAARDLRQVRGVGKQLVDCLRNESSPSVRAALFDALTEGIDGETVVALISLLRSEDAALRNGAVEALHLVPDQVGPYMQDLLADEDSDIRLFALDILRTLPHSQAPDWLLEVLRKDAHVNVIAVAIDRLADLGNADMRDDLLEVKMRFVNEPFISFAVDSALHRLEADHG